MLETGRVRAYSLTPKARLSQGVDVAGRVRGFSLFATGFFVYLLHMLVPMSSVAEYVTAAGGASLMLISALLSQEKNEKFDAIAALLVVRAIWLTLVNFFSGGGLDYFINGAYFSAIVSIFIYIGCRRYAEDNRSPSLMTVSMIILFVVIFVQTALCYIQLGSFSDFRTGKYAVSIPFGESNAIAMGYIGVGLYLFYTLKTRLHRGAVIALMIAGSVLLASTGSLLSLAIVVVYLVLAAIDLKKSYSSTTLLFGCLTSMALVLVVVNIAQGGLVTTLFASTFEKLDRLASGNYLSASTNRTFIYSYYLDLFYENPVVGYGTAPVTAVWGAYETYRPHNWILEALYHGGIPNLILFATVCFLGFKNARRGAFPKACCILAAYLLVDSLFEPGIFGINKDFLFWCALGFASVKRKRSA
jgi:O-antigen ligase